jgi:hypothetical protein
VPTAFNRGAARLVVPGVLVFAYAVLYPTDWAALLAPVERILNASFAVSPWLYAVIGVAILARAAVRIWGRPSTSAVPREEPRP